MVSFPLKRLQRLPWRLRAQPLPLSLCLSERAVCKDASFPPPPPPHNTTSMDYTLKENETAAVDEIVSKRRNNGSIMWK